MATSVQCALAYSFSQVTISHLSARGNVCFSEPSILAICPFPNVHRLAFLSVTHGAWKLSPIRFLISHNKQKWNKLKTSDFCGAVRRLKSLWNLEVQVNSESDSRDGSTWAGTRLLSLRVKCPGSSHSTYVFLLQEPYQIITQISEKSQTVGVTTSESNLWNKPSVLCLPYKLYSKRKTVIFKVLFCIEGRTVSQMWQPPLASLPHVKRKMRSGGQGELPKVEPFWGSLCWGSEMLKVEIWAHEHKASPPNTSPPHQWDPKLRQIITTKILAGTDRKPPRMSL